MQKVFPDFWFKCSYPLFSYSKYAIFSSLICTFAFAIFSSQNTLTQIFNLDKFLPYKLSWDGFMDGVCIGPNSSNCIH